jgi:hypothetical protein
MTLTPSPSRRRISPKKPKTALKGRKHAVANELNFGYQLGNLVLFPAAVAKRAETLESPLPRS